MSIFGGFFHKSGHENPENIDNNHHVPVDDHVPTDDELLGEDEEIMREAYLKNHPEEISKTSNGSKVEFPKDELNS